MTLKWPALKAALEQHTVETPRGRLAGFLVRCTASRKELGYVWQAGSAWRWRMPDGGHSGERSSQRAAVQVLRDAHDLTHGLREKRLLDILEDEPAILESARVTVTLPPMKPRRVDPKPPATPKVKREVLPPTPPVKKIDWNTYQPTNVTAALGAALKDEKEKR
jgi:hypothetical protein